MASRDYPTSRALKDIYLPVGIRTSNPDEISVAQDLEAQGWTLHKRGWPDFVAVKGDEIRFIEVKGREGIDLKTQQKVIAILLERATGIPVEKLVPQHPPFMTSGAREFFEKIDQPASTSDGVM